jgi:hypothetical protein
MTKLQNCPLQCLKENVIVVVKVATSCQSVVLKIKFQTKIGPSTRPRHKKPPTSNQIFQKKIAVMFQIVGKSGTIPFMSPIFLVYPTCKRNIVSPTIQQKKTHLQCIYQIKQSSLLKVSTGYIIINQV